jgi:hypothetical protein
MIEQSDLGTASRGPGEYGTSFRRIIASLLAFGATVYLGVVVGRYLAVAVLNCTIKKIAGIPIEWGLTAVGASYVLASLEKVLKLANTFREYLLKPNTKVALYPECVALMCIVAYVTLVRLAFVADTECKQPARTQTPAKELVYLARATDSDVLPLEWVPFFFPDLAGGEQNAAKGTTLSDQQLADVETFAKSMKACVGDSPGQDVELEVRGYADANEFPVNSDEENRKVANRRASALHQALKRALGTQTGASFVILHSSTEWPVDDPKAMTREARYLNALALKQTGEGRDQGLFNRRADILLLKLGVCGRLQTK